MIKTATSDILCYHLYLNRSCAGDGQTLGLAVVPHDVTMTSHSRPPDNTTPSYHQHVGTTGSVRRHGTAECLLALWNHSSTSRKRYYFTLALHIVFGFILFYMCCMADFLRNVLVFWIDSILRNIKIKSNIRISLLYVVFKWYLLC